jgi:hypothetical protein
MSASDVIALITGLPALIASITALILAIKAPGKAIAAVKATPPEKTS